MALDGIAISNVVYELRQKILDGRIDKVYQPERDEINIFIRCAGENHRLLLSANSSHPRIHLFKSAGKDNPITAPLFCMVLRKHLSGGKIRDITQPNFERIINIEIESFNEMGDLSVKTLIMEIMGKHSNIMLVDADGTVLDSVKHISHDTSSVREVLPGKEYVLPPSQQKHNPTKLNREAFDEALESFKNGKIQDMIYQRFTGISPVIASEVCTRAGLSADSFCEALTPGENDGLFRAFSELMDAVNQNLYNCAIYFDKKEKPVDFSSVDMSMFNGYDKKTYESISELLEFYYVEKDKIYRANQKTSDLRKLIQTNIDRCVKKSEIYTRTSKEIAGRDRHKTAGELITSNIYIIEKGMTSFTTNNFYDPDNAEITIALDANLTPSENAQRYFKKYSKEKRTAEALKDQITVNNGQLSYLDGLLNTLHTCTEEADIEEIREELAEQGFIKKRKPTKGKKPVKTKPLHYISSDGIDIYVGKNNKQNDELTLKFADASDYWFHTKDIPGSHVILKTNGNVPPEASMNEAAVLAAFYSKAKNGSHVPVDYTYKKYVKKPAGAKPGMVIYENNKTAYVTPAESFIKGLKLSSV